LGNYLESKSLLERALKIQEFHLGSDHPDLASTLGNLATTHRSLGNYLESKSLLERALKIQEFHLGSDHPSLASTLGNLATTHRSLGNYLESKSLHERALKIKEFHLGPDHPELAISEYNLAVCYSDTGHYSKAKALITHAIKIYGDKCGITHPFVLQMEQALQTIQSKETQNKSESHEAIHNAIKNCSIHDKNIINEAIILKRVGCLNNKISSASLQEILQIEGSSKCLESDCDEQLLIFLEFQHKVNLQSIYINSLAPTAPSVLKFFVNRTDIDFSSVEEEEFDQELTFTSLSQTLEFDLSKFENLEKLTIFVEGNQDDQPTTTLNQLLLFGVKSENTDMTNFSHTWKPTS